ncbi:MAG: AAA family ATPase [Rhodospirillales bacterium]|nr:AAA family ATPase [Rhodospirillales bacterium]
MMTSTVPLEEAVRQGRRDSRPAWTGAPLEGVIDPVSLQGARVPVMEWVVPQWVPLGTVTLLGGDGGVGKSLLAQQLVTACARGLPWLGLPVRRCRALGIFCEDSGDELHRRQARINAAYGIDFADLGDCLWASRVGHDNLLWVKEGAYDPPRATPLFEQILGSAVAFGAGLVVIDSLHDVYGANENARPEARQFIQHLQMIAEATGGAVILTAHPSLTGMASGTGMSGSTAWNAAVRSRLYLTRPRPEAEDDDARRLERKKANYAKANDSLALRWHEGVLAPDGPMGGGGGMVGAIENRLADRIFLDCLDAAARQGRPVSDAKNSVRYAPRMFATMAQAKGMTRRDLERAMARLFNAGAIRVGSSRAGNRHAQRALVRDAE